MSIGSEITQLLINQGTIAANRAQQQGQITAQTIGGVTQAAQGAIQQLTDPKVLEYQRTVKGRKVLAAGLKTVPPKEDGTPDYQGIAAYVGQNGFPDLGESFLDSSTKNQANLATLDKLKRDAKKANQELEAHTMQTIGDAAFRADSPAAFQSAVGVLHAHQQIDDQTAMGILGAADQGGPDGWKAIREKYLKFSPEWQEAEKKKNEPFTLPPTPQGAAPAQRVVGGVTVATGGASTPKPKTKDEYAADAANPNSPTQAESQAVLDKINAGTTPAAKPENYRVKGVGDVPLEVVTGRGPNDSVRYFLNQGDGKRREVFAGKDFTTIPPATVQLNPPVSSDPDHVDPTVKAISEYRQAPPPIGRAGTRAIMDAVNKYNPAYDATKFPERQRVRNAYATGTEGQQLNALNTAIMHMDLLADAADALKNGNFKPGNAVYNKFVDMFGAAEPNSYATIKEFLDGEVGSVVKKGAATEGEMGRLESKGGATSSPAQLKRYIKNAMNILGGKAVVLNDKYHSVMGADDPFSAVSQRSEEVLTKHGFNPSEFGANKKPSALSVKAPDGKTYTFKSQADLDAFKKAAGL